MTSVTILSPISPHSHIFSCPNAGDHFKARRSKLFLEEWTNTYLKEAQDRLQKQIDDYPLTIEDIYTMQQMCAFEVSFVYCPHPRF
jgi:hypothetical protein